MTRFILPVILIGIAVICFFTFITPLYGNLSAARAQLASYNEALSNSKALANQRDKLTQKYNSFDPANLSKLVTLLPDNVDNIRLILEIENLATPYGMVLRDIKYNTGQTAAVPATGVVQGGTTASVNKNYGTWSLEFSTQGTYSNFVNFTKDLEKNLRIVDITSVNFASDTGVGISPSLSSIYKYAFTINTYWLKN